jgi:hypothetical protein
MATKTVKKAKITATKTNKKGVKGRPFGSKTFRPTTEIGVLKTQNWTSMGTPVPNSGYRYITLKARDVPASLLLQNLERMVTEESPALMKVLRKS